MTSISIIYFFKQSIFGEMFCAFFKINATWFKMPFVFKCIETHPLFVRGLIFQILIN